MKRQVKPDVREISLAYNPDHRRKFFLIKEAGMEKLLEILQAAELLNEKNTDSFLQKLVKEKKVKEEDIDTIKAALKLFNSVKDNLPPNFMGILAKDVSEYAVFALAQESPKDAKKRKEAEKAELIKEIRPEVVKEVKAELKAEEGNSDDGDNEQITALEADIKELKKDNKDMKKEIDASNKKVDEAEEKARRAELLNDLKAMDAVGDYEKHITMVLNLEKKVGKKEAQEYLDGLKDNAERLKAAGLFSDVGHDGRLVSGENAFDKLKEEVVKMVKDRKISEVEAWKLVPREHPQLFSEYRKQEKLQSRGTA